MARYEYQFMTIGEKESIIERLNAAGQEGWRVVKELPSDYPSYLMEREINGAKTEPGKFKGDDTIMVYMHDGPHGYGPCRFQNEADVQNLATQAPANIYHFLHVE